MYRKILFVLNVCFIIFILSSCSKGKNPIESKIDITELQGPYLGQTPPGITPKIFAPGIISKKSRDAFLITLPGGEELYYGTISGNANNVETRILSTKIEDDYWVEPYDASFTSNYLDGYLGLHPDGSKIYFQTNRPINASESTYEWNIWVVDRIGDTWGEPQSIGQPINGRNHTSGPSVTTDTTMYFTLMTIGGLQEIYRSKYISGEYQEPERLPNSVNSVQQQFDSYIAPDESYLIFNAELDDSYGGIDLYISFRDENDNWSNAINLGPAINTNDDDGSVTISPDGQYIFFWRMNGNNNLDIYWVSSQYLDNLR